MKPDPFPVGTLVKLHPPKPALHAMTVGQVVPYHGEHDPENPRVRWASGWGVTSRADELIALTAEEIRNAPPISLVDTDRSHS